jgi:hypothetical protein
VGYGGAGVSKMKDKWDPVAHARRTDPSTSHEAAAEVTKKLTAYQESVMNLFLIRGEMTDVDLQNYYGLSAGSTFRTRRSELVKMGKLRNSGRKRVQDGSNRIIWEIVP